MNSKKIKYSIIIPTFNEQENIGSLLTDLEKQSGNLKYNIEVILVDGKSTDNTFEICKSYNVSIIQCERGRGKQLSEGAKIAKGEYLFFLHADLILPASTFQFLDRNLENSSQISTFRMKLDENKILYNIYSFFTRFDSVFTTFGDQGIIVNKNFYNNIGGFTTLPIMEDLEFFRRARRFTKIKKFNKYITVSSRRFKNIGVIKTQIKSFICIINFISGVDPDIIYKDYYNSKYEQNKRNYPIRKISGIKESQN